MLGQLGVVSGTALDTMLVRRLQAGDEGGHLRRAIAAFPIAGVGDRVIERYFRDPDGAAQNAGSEDGGSRFQLLPLLRATLTPEREALIVLANFVEVFLAKEGHRGVVGINLLEKIQFPTLPSLYGAMLAGVDVVLMGAGIPAEIPAALDRLSRHEPASIGLAVLDMGGATDHYELRFDPRTVADAPVLSRPLAKPNFLPIIASVVLAKALLKKAPGGIDGFVVEGPTAGGHNAPPRGAQKLTVRGEPIYGERDVVDLAEMRALGVPFWLAGAYSTREKLAAAIAAGARGIQAGTVFALCAESGLEPSLRERLVRRVLSGEAEVFTDPLASPTGFPFKIASLEGTLSETEEFARRPRLCDLGYLRRAYRKEDGTLGYRCPGEPVDDYVRKGGKAEETVGRKCLCNGLMSNIGLGQARADGYEERALVTVGDDLSCIRPFVSTERATYGARDVIASLLAPA